MTSLHHAPLLRQARWLATWLLMGAALVVSAPEAQAQDKFPFPVRVMVTDAKNDPVPKVPVMLDSKVVGYTDKDGKFEGTLTEANKTEISLALGPLDGWRYLDEASRKATLTIHPGLDGNPVGRSVEMKVKAKPTKVETILWVRARCDDKIERKHCANLPVMLDGKEVTRTDAFGRAHVKLDANERSAHKLQIDTPDYDKEKDDSALMVPRDPEYTFEVGAEPGVFYVNEAFTDAMADAKKTTRRSAPTTRRASPTRRAAPTRRTTTRRAVKKKGGDEVIDLFN